MAIDAEGKIDEARMRRLADSPSFPNPVKMLVFRGSIWYYKKTCMEAFCPGEHGKSILSVA